MTNQEIIKRKFAAFRQKVDKGGNNALADQMKRTMEQSLNLHLVLEEGAHTHHLNETDTHGWAVADSGNVVSSGFNEGPMDNLSASAQRDAEAEAASSGKGHVGVFSAIMDDIDSWRFEEKIQDLLKVSAESWFPTYFKRSINIISINERL